MYISVVLVCDTTKSLYQNVHQGTTSFIKKVLPWGKKSASLSSVLSDVVDLHYFLVVTVKQFTDQQWFGDHTLGSIGVYIKSSSSCIMKDL